MVPKKKINTFAHDFSGKVAMEAIFFNEQSCSWERLLEPASDSRIPVEMDVLLQLENSGQIYEDEIPVDIMGKVFLFNFFSLHN